MASGLRPHTRKKLKASTVYSRADMAHQVMIVVTREEMEKLEKISKDTGQTITEAASIIFHAQMKNYKKLEESIKKAISEGMDESYSQLEEELMRINQPTERFNKMILELFPLLKEKLQKKESN